MGRRLQGFRKEDRGTSGRKLAEQAEQLLHAGKFKEVITLLDPAIAKGAERQAA